MTENRKLDCRHGYWGGCDKKIYQKHFPQKALIDHLRMCGYFFFIMTTKIHAFTQVRWRDTEPSHCCREKTGVYFLTPINKWPPLLNIMLTLVRERRQGNIRQEEARKKILETIRNHSYGAYDINTQNLLLSQTSSEEIKQKQSLPLKVLAARWNIQK